MKTLTRITLFARKALDICFALMLGSAWIPSSALSAQELEHAGAKSETEESAPSYGRTEADYSTPDVNLVRQDGVKVSLPRELGDGRSVVLSFIYSSCTAICPMLSQTLSQFQKRLGKDARKVHIVSISIDPEGDSIAHLRAYAARFKAGPGWDHYTGTRENSITVQKSFDAYRGDKMNHTPLFLLRSAPSRPWVRLDGVVSPKSLEDEYRLALRDSRALSAGRAVPD